jgi:hypothetical protein
MAPTRVVGMFVQRNVDERLTPIAGGVLEPRVIASIRSIPCLLVMRGKLVKI